MAARWAKGREEWDISIDKAKRDDSDRFPFSSIYGDTKLNLSSLDRSDLRHHLPSTSA